MTRFEAKPASRVFKSQHASAVFADPDYDFTLSADRLTATRVSAAEDIRSFNFSALPETMQEATSVASYLANSSNEKIQIFSGKDASEQNLFKLKSPKILHIASHGFFLKKNDELKRNPFLMSASERPERLLNDNPLMRSGIALAGANQSIMTGHGHGIVTAEKIAGLDLTDTELVVLSACNTGSGDIQDGEGVLGLQRSMLAAGAKKLIASYWPVASDETVTLMSDMYESFVSGNDIASSLRDSKIKMIKQNLSPYYWGAFTCISSNIQ
jgi:CHAT domain-containing protein